jgi:hypothetical protein
LNQLVQAYHYAQETGHDCWQFAVAISELRRSRVTESDLRWLVSRGYVRHAEEIIATNGERAFDFHVNLRFGKRTAFIVTESGIAHARELLNRALNNEYEENARERRLPNALLPAIKLPYANKSDARDEAETRPTWDRDRRELRLAGQVVKVFKLPSPMQEAILMAFEEENWPTKIDDPLPFHPEVHPKRRLHETIRSLNRNQKNNLIRFVGDGTGEGVRWELSRGAQ